MKVTFKTQESAKIVVIFAAQKEKELVLSPPASKFDKASKKRISTAAEAASFTGGAGSLLTIHAPNSDCDICILVGLGDHAKISGETIERGVASAVKSVLTLGPKSLSVLLAGWGKISNADNAARAGLGACLAAYRFDKYRTKLSDAQKPKLESVNIDIEDGKAAFKHYSAVADGVDFARDLMNEPPNILNPVEFASRLKELGKLGVEVTILGDKEMAELGMHSFLGVGQGSKFPNQLVVMNYRGGGKDAPLALVGKGLCFDSGGISIKPSGGMEDMKGDMGGAAAVSGAMLALATRKAKANVVGLVGLSENMPGGNAQRPGDIVTSMSGQTIEILNTDAEGRLVLCDVLTYAQEKFAPKYVVDLATLTGAIVISLGDQFAGLFSNSDDLSGKITKAGEAAGENVWRFPQTPAYNKMLDSNIADMKNVQRSGPGAGAGSITAAQFLGRFIKDGVNWAHIDIAGVAWKSGSDDPREPSWGTGFGVRLLDRLVADHFES